MNQKGFANILIVIVIIAVLGVAGYYIATRKPGLPTNTQQPNQEDVILSFSIEPSTKVQGWVMYRDGAKAILKGKNLKSAEVRYVPTGTGITESSSAGKMNKVAESSSGDTWELKLPKNILSTNFWADVGYLSGQKSKSTDLGNVGYEENSETKNWKTYTNAKYGIEFKYPPSLTLTERERTHPTGDSFEVLFHRESDAVALTVVVYPENPTGGIDQSMNYIKTNYTDVQKTVVNNYPALRYSNGNNVIIFSGQKSYSFGNNLIGGGKPLNAAEFNTLLNSFYIKN